MGDRYLLEIDCPNCGFHDDEVYYAPTCGFTTWKCIKCGNIIDLEKYTGITYKDASNLDKIQNVIDMIKYPNINRLCRLEYPDFPTIVCLCGSTRFKQEFIKANFEETMKDKIVLSVGFFAHADSDQYQPTKQEKEHLDQLHKQKIELADEILVINVGGYIGESTRSEIEYAKKLDKLIRYLED